MKDMVERFCDAIDRAYKDDPEKLEGCVRIFSRVCEETLGVTLVGPGEKPKNDLIPMPVKAEEPED